jgi:hypothetical protein
LLHLYEFLAVFITCWSSLRYLRKFW